MNRVKCSECDKFGAVFVVTTISIVIIMVVMMVSDAHTCMPINEVTLKKLLLKMTFRSLGKSIAGHTFHLIWQCVECQLATRPPGTKASNCVTQQLVPWGVFLCDLNFLTGSLAG